MAKKGAVSPHKTPTSEGEWDGPEAGTRLKGPEALKDAHAWRDPDGDPEVKSSYKFIHHEVSSGGKVGAANVRASTSGIGVLNGGRGGTDIPQADRKGVYDHLAGHLKDAGKEPPELK